MEESRRKVRRSLLSDVDEKMDLAVVSAVVSFFIIVVCFVLSFPSLLVGFLISILLAIAVFISVYIDQSNAAVGFIVFVMTAVFGLIIRWPAWLIMTVATTILFAMGIFEQVVFSSRK